MKLRNFILPAAVLLAAAALFAHSGRSSAPAQMSPLAWLIGGVWTADASAMGNGMQRIETRYQWSDNGSFLRFNTHFVTSKAEIKTYDGNFFWNPSKASLAMWYADAQGAVTEGPVKVDGNTTDILFRAPDFNGKVADMRARVTRKDNDLYNWALAEQEGGDWKLLATLDYHRK